MSNVTNGFESLSDRLRARFPSLQINFDIDINAPEGESLTWWLDILINHRPVLWASWDFHNGFGIYDADPSLGGKPQVVRDLEEAFTQLVTKIEAAQQTPSALAVK